MKPVSPKSVPKVPKIRKIPAIKVRKSAVPIAPAVSNVSVINGPAHGCHDHRAELDRGCPHALQSIKSCFVRGFSYNRWVIYSCFFRVIDANQFGSSGAGRFRCGQVLSTAALVRPADTVLRRKATPRQIRPSTSCPCSRRPGRHERGDAPGPYI